MRYFFSAAQKQMDQLEADGLIADGTRKNVVNNQVVLLTRKDSGTEVTGLEDLDKAESIALARKCTGWKVYKRSACQPWDPSGDRGCIKDSDRGSVKSTRRRGNQRAG